METDNIPINKIVSILVAIIVTGCVLVPICNQFGNSGGSGVGEIYNNPVTPMSEIDLSDHSKVYEYDASEYEDGTILVYIEDGTMEDSLILGCYSSQVSLIEHDWGDKIKIEYFDEANLWCVWIYHEGVYAPVIFIFESDHCYVYDENGTEYRTLLAVEEYTEFDSLHNIDKIKVFPESDFGIYMYTENEISGDDGLSVSAEIIFTPGNTDLRITELYVGHTELSESDYSIVSVPTVTISEDGTLIFGKTYTLNILGEDYEFEYEVINGIADVPKTVTISSDSSDSGIAGTLITVIPVFVLLAIIGSIAFMFIDRKETL